MKRQRLYTAVVLMGAFLVLVIGCSEDNSQIPQFNDQTTEVVQLWSVLHSSEDGELIEIPGSAQDFAAASATNGLIVTMPPESLTCDGVITFEDVTAMNYDAIFESDGADFAERFVGQTLSFSGDSDILSGTPTNPLALQAGDPNDNVLVFTDGACGATQVLGGLGPIGYPNSNSIGEGSFAVLFDYDQSEFGFRICGGDGGSATVSFFKRDGSLISQATVSGLGDQVYAFQRVGGENDIAGISIHNTDAAGIAFDDLCHDIQGVPGPPIDLSLDIKPTSCPNPINPVSRGVVPVAILGGVVTDVLDIDVTSLLLEGVAPIRSEFMDVATPVGDGEQCECTTDGPDGIMDLTLKFKTQELVAALGPIQRDDVLVLTITGVLLDGTPFSLTDCMIVKGKNTPVVAN
jgi:hypothetical protein